MGKGLTGEYSLSNTLFDMASYYLLNSVGAIPKAEAQLPEAQAQEPSYPIITRGETWETTQFDKHNYTTKSGLVKYIERFDGEWIPHEYWEDANLVTFNSADISFIFDKNSCAYTVYNDGRIFNNSTEVIKSDTWVVKFAENGTDNWADVPQQSLGCTTEVFDLPDDTFQIKYTKSDVNGTIHHVMNKTVGLGMKHIVSYTNDNPSWNNTKIGFSHILQGTPEHLTIETISGSGNNTNVNVDKYSTDSIIPDSMNNNSTIIDEQNPVDIQHDDLLINGTMWDSGFNFHFVDNDKNQIHYDFDEGLDKLWNMRFLEELDGNVTTTKVFLDYMNDPALLGIGETVTIDPIVTATTPQVRAVTINGGVLGCSNNGLGCTATTVDGVWNDRIDINQIKTVFATYDISGIPSQADVQQVRLGHQVTNIFNLINRASVGANLYTWNGEDFQSLSAQDLANCIYTSPFPFGEENPHTTPSDSGTTTIPAQPNPLSGNQRNDNRVGLGNPTSNPCGGAHISGLDSPTIPRDAAFTLNSGADVITHDGTGELSQDLEERFLKLGLTKYTYTMINNNKDELHFLCSGSTANLRAHGLTGGAATIANSAVIPPQGVAFGTQYCPQTQILGGNIHHTVDPNGINTFLEVTYVVLTQASAPLGLTCTPTSPTTVDLDWFPPNDLGGAAFVDGYHIQRDSGGGFTDLVADTGSALTFYTDNTVSAGSTFTYRIAAITGFGDGVYSSEVSCGVAGVSDEVTDLTAQNQALNVVALDWSEPLFTGNTPVTGYQIDRTEGTPPPVNDDWNFMSLRLAANYVNMPNSITTSGFKMGSTTTGGGILSQGVFWKSFPVSQIEDEQIRIDAIARSFGDISGCTGSVTFQIYDGEYTHAEMDTLNDPYDQFPTKGHGLLQTITPALVCTPFVSTVNHATPNTLVPIDISTFPTDAIEEQVTVVIKSTDTNALGSCVICNWDSTVREIEITNVKQWDFDSVVFSSYAEDVPQSCQQDCGTVTAGAVVELQDPLGFKILVADTGNTNVEYLDNTVDQLTNYGYRVFVINGEGVSDSSNIVSIQTAGQPEQVAVPTVTATGTQTIDVSWVEPNLNGGGLVGYEIERKVGVGGIFTTLVGGLTELSYTDGEGLFTLTPATEYCYRVGVETVIGSSSPEFSDEACATTFDAPSEVTNLTVTALDGSSVNMSFDDPVSDGGSAITGYKIEQQIGAGAFTVLDPLTFTQFRNDTGLPVGTLITYRVTASNQFGFGNPITASDTTDATPQVPQDFVCSAGTPDSINLSWSTPVTFSPPTGYQIQRNVDGGAFVVHVADTASTATTYNDGGLTTDTIYGYKILAHTAEGDTLLTPEVFCQPLKQPDAPPENFKAEFGLFAPHDVTLTWDIPEQFGVPLDSITVERDDGAGYEELAVLPPNAVGMVDSNLNNDVKQKYRIKLTGSLGDSKYGFAIPSDLNRVSHFNFENTINDSGDSKNSATVSGVINFDETGHAGTRAFDYDGSSYVIVDVGQESDYDFERTTPFGGALYYEGGNAGGASFTDDWYAINHRHNGISVQQFNIAVNSLGVNFDFTGSASGTQGSAYLFKTFNKTDIDGKTFDIDYHGYHRGFLGGCSGYADVRILDGSYDLNNFATDFPNTSAILSKGAGVVQTLHTHACSGTSPSVMNWSFDGISPTIDLSSSTESQVTVFFRLIDTNSHPNSNGVTPRMSITDMTLNKVGGADERIFDFTTTQGSTYTEDDPVACLYNCGTVESVEISLLGIQALITKAQTLASVGWAFYLDGGFPVLRMNGATQSIEVKSDEFVSTNILQHLAFTSNGNSTGAGIEIFVNGNSTGVTIVSDTLTSESILNNEPLVIGATSTGTNILQSVTDEVMIFGENLEDEEVTEIVNDEVETTAPINATMTLTGSTFADISSETPTITLISGFPLPDVSGNLELKNFTTTTVNTASGLSMPASGVLNVPALFNQMGSTSNYTAIATLDNGLDVFVVISNEDIQNPLFTLPAGIDFFFQQQRINNFENLSFNFTKTSIPFDLACNLKSELFEDGITYEFENVGFLQEIFDVPRTKDVVVACIDQNSPLLNPDEPSFGGSNALLTFVSFGDTTGIGAFLNFTDNYGDFFGAPLPYLFIILAAALFTGRSAPTGIIVIGIALGIMWYLGILVVDPVLWGIIVVLVILGAIGGKKFL
jgi:hypothetical protein